MSLEHFSKIIYQDLPSQNLGFVEAGVFVCPSMIGLTLPTDMQDRDLYIYMCLYNQLMKKLALAKNERQGEAIVKIASKELGVSPDKFEKDTGKIYMVECLIANQMIPGNFQNIQSIFKRQEERSNEVLTDLERNIDETAKSIGSKLKNKVALNVQNVTSKRESVSDVPPPDTTPSQAPSFSTSVYAGNNQLALSTSTGADSKKDLGFLSTAKDFAMKPPVLIGSAVGAYFLLSKYVFNKEEQPVTRIRRKNRKKSKKKRYRS